MTIMLSGLLLSFIPTFIVYDMSCNVLQCIEHKTIEERQIERLYRQKISYGLGCEDGYSKCRDNRYDCSGIITASLREIGCYSGKKASSGLLQFMGKKVPVTEARVGDLVFFKRIEGTGQHHIAIVTQGRDGEKLLFGDFYENKSYFKERDTPIRGNRRLSFRISINRPDCQNNTYTYQQLYRKSLSYVRK